MGGEDVRKMQTVASESSRHHPSSPSVAGLDALAAPSAAVVPVPVVGAYVADAVCTAVAGWPGMWCHGRLALILHDEVLVCVCVCVCMCVSVCVCIFMCVCMQVYVYTCTHSAGVKYLPLWEMNLDLLLGRA